MIRFWRFAKSVSARLVRFVLCEAQRFGLAGQPGACFVLSHVLQVTLLRPNAAPPPALPLQAEQQPVQPLVPECFTS